MIELIKFACSDFWVFCGVIIILQMFLYFIVNGIIRMWSRFIRFLMVRKHGWPPAHLDADGDWQPKNKITK